MKKGLALCVFIFVFFLPFTSNSQLLKRLDSLKKVYNNTKAHDTTRARAMLRYISAKWNYSDSNITLLVQADSLSRKYNKEDLTASLVNEKLELYARCREGCRQQLFKEATNFLFYCQQHHDTLNMARAYKGRASAYLNYDMLDKAIPEQVKAVELSVKAKEDFEKQYNIYLVGYYMFNNKQYKEALPYFLKAYRMTVRNNIQNMIAENSGWIANTYNALKMFDSALYYRHLSLNDQQKYNNKIGIADGYRYLGNIYQNMGMLDSALAVYQRSCKLFAAIGSPAWIQKYFVALIYYKMGKYKPAADMVDEILDTVKGSKIFVSTYLTTQLAGKVYDKAGQSAKAILAYQKLIKMDDSIQKADKADNVTEMNAKMQFEQAQQMQQIEQEHQDALAQKDKQRQAIIRNVLIIGFIGLLFFAGIMYRNFLQKKKANILLARQKSEIEYQKKEIQDSINYARNIQSAILPDEEIMKQSFPGLFVLYKPKNVVSGDFYWHATVNGKTFIAAVDCTGHGVPGAFMSMIGNDKLNNIILKDGESRPGKILSQLNLSVKEVLHQNINKGTALRDGMDLALLSCLPKGDKTEIVYAGANRPLYIIRDKVLEEVKPTKVSIGGHTANDQQFEEHSLILNKGDVIYLCSDGYADQFGGSKSKKYTTKQFKETVVSISSEPIQRQKDLLDDLLVKWQGNEEQVDDILVIGIRA